MQNTDIRLNLGDVTAYNYLLDYTCHKVLSSDLDNRVYIGDFAHLLSVDSVDLVLKQAYGKILRMLHHVYSLRRKRNSLLSISCLPSEILLRIFYSCGPLYAPTVCAVCVHWRRLALADPSLWTYLDLTRRQFAKLGAERSRPMPVSIFSTSFNDLSLDFLPGRERIGCLKLHLPMYLRDDVEQERVSKYFCGQFPLLNTIDLTSYGEPKSSICDLGKLEAPHLRNLHLSNWALRDWNMPIMHSLGSLSLLYSPPGQRQGGEAMFTLSRLLAVFRACPRLKSLRLQGLIDASAITHVAEADLNEVKLLHLKSLDIRENTTIICQLLHRLQMPVVNDIVIHCELDGPATVNSLESLSNLIAGILRTARWPPLREAKLKLGFDFEIAVHIGRWNGESQFKPEPHSLEFRARNMASLPPFVGSAFISSISSILFSKVTTLNVECYAHWGDAKRQSRTVWATFSNTLSALQTIDFSGCICDSFVGLLLALDRSLAIEEYADDIVRSDVPFPALRLLRVQRLRMVRSVQGNSLLAYLVALLHRRRQQNDAYHWPLTVILNECAVLEGDMITLDMTNLDISFSDAYYEEPESYRTRSPSPAILWPSLPSANQ